MKPPSDRSDRQPNLANKAKYAAVFGGMVLALAAAQPRSASAGSEARPAPVTTTEMAHDEDFGDFFEGFTFEQNKKMITQEMRDLKAFLEGVRSSKEPQLFFGAVSIKSRPGKYVDKTYPGKFGYKHHYLGLTDPYPTETFIINPIIRSFQGKKYMLGYEYVTEAKNFPLSSFTDTSNFDSFISSLNKAPDDRHIFNLMPAVGATQFMLLYMGLTIFDIGYLKSHADLSYWQLSSHPPKMIHTMPSADGKTVVEKEPGYPTMGMAASTGPDNAQLVPRNSTVPDYLAMNGYRQLPPSFKPPF